MSNKFSVLLPTTLSIMIASSISAATINYSRNNDQEDDSRLNRIISNLNAGDRLIIKNGTYRNFELNVPNSVRGTSRDGIVIRAETAGRVRFTGHSFISIGARYVTVQGFFYDRGRTVNNAVINFRDTNRRLASDCRVTSCVVDRVNALERNGTNPANYAFVTGSRNVVDNCAFYGKDNNDAMVHFAYNADNATAVRALGECEVKNCWFGYTRNRSGNGLEAIRVSAGSHPLVKSNTEIRNNLFEQCDADAETISIKGSGVLIRGNTLSGCRGDLNIRSTNNSIINGNIILKGGDTSVGGLRASGRGHRITGNYVSESSNGLRLLRGTADGFYDPVVDAVVEGNTFFKTRLVDFAGRTPNGTIDPRRTSFRDNLILRNTSSSNDPFEARNTRNVANSGNVAVKTTNGGWGAITVTSSAVRRNSDGLYYPINPSLSSKGAPVADMQERTRSNTGPSWYTKPSAFVPN